MVDAYTVMSQSTNTSAPATPVIERPPPLARSSTSPITPVFEDPEGQDDSRWKSRPRGFRRTSTFGSFGSSTFVEEKTPPKRRSTTATIESSVSSAEPLERTPTLVVDQEASHGYPMLASFLGGVEGYAIYKRFASLNARNLLYHQAKLIHLEHELGEMEKSLAGDPDLHYSVHHIFSAESGTRRGKLRHKYEEVSRELEKYNGLLLDQHKLHALPTPDDAFVDSIHNFINCQKTPKPGWLQHPENTIYAVWDNDRKPVQSDLVTLNRDFRTQDPFTAFFCGKFLNWWHYLYSRFKKPDDDFGGYVYTEGALSRYMRAVVMIMGSALPTCSIVALYFINSPIYRLLFIVLFSGVFSAALAFFTDAKRVEIFAASAALASVQVVFVGTAFGNGNGSGNGNGKSNG